MSFGQFGHFKDHCDFILCLRGQHNEPSTMKPHVGPINALSWPSVPGSLYSHFLENSSRNCVKWSSLYHSYSLVIMFSSAQLCLTFCNPMDCSTPGLPVHHQLLEFTQTHVHRVGDPLLSPSLAFNLSQHQGLFKWVSSSHQVAKVLGFQLQHQFFQWIFRTDLP